MRNSGPVTAQTRQSERRASQPRLTKAQRLAFLNKKALLPGAIFAATVTAYCASLLAALAAASPVASLIASLLCGLCIALLFVVGHDACHQSFTRRKLANHLIGRIAFLPSLHPFSLWDLGHNRTHHRYNNIRGKDYVWEPLSPADYRASPFLAKIAYRFFRTPPGIFFYYGVSIWAARMFFVFPWRLPGRKRAYLLDLVTVWVFLAVQSYAVVGLGSLFAKGPILSLLLGCVLPFIVWNALMSFVIYLHHTHPTIRWYNSVEAWRSRNGALSGTAYVEFPGVVQKLILHIMEHGAHHHAPGVPLYNLVPLQKIVLAHGGPRWRWSFPEFLRICRECKLFDYETGTWRRFDSAPAAISG